MRYNRPSAGFTLMELMVVLIIIGVVAGLALPRYTRSVSIAKERRALNNLMLISAAEATYFKYNNAYWPGPGPVQNLAAINANLATNILADGDTFSCRNRPAVQNYYECTVQFDNGSFTLLVNGAPIAEGVNPCCSAGACPLTPAC